MSQMTLEQNENRARCITEGRYTLQPRQRVSFAPDNLSVKINSITRASMFVGSGYNQKPKKRVWKTSPLCKSATKSTQQYNRPSIVQNRRTNTFPSCMHDEQFLLLLLAWSLAILALQNAHINSQKKKKKLINVTRREKGIRTPNCHVVFRE